MTSTTRLLALPCSLIAMSLGCTLFDNGVTVPAADAPVALVAAITVPGNPITSGTKSWVDAQMPTPGVYLGSLRFYLTDVSNAGVDIIDASNNTYLGRVPGFVGAAGTAGGTPTTNGAGPNSIVFAPGNVSFVSDGNSTVQVVDNSSMKIIASVSTAITACDGGTATTHYCGRTNEITYDPEDQIVFVQNPSPLAVAAPHGAIDNYGTFISAVAPYAALGTISFPGAAGQEAPLWDPDLHRILTAVSGSLTGTAPNQTVVNPQYVAVIDPKVRPFTVEKKYVIDCQALTGTVALGINDPALGPDQHMVIPACGKPVIMDARTGTVLTVITQVGGGNETWYNPGDRRFYVTGADATTGVTSLGVIDAVTNRWLQNVPAPQITNPTASVVNNHIFAVVQVTAAQVADPTTDNSACAGFGAKGKGCIAVFAHVKP